MESASHAIMRRMSCFASCLVLKFVEEAWESAAEGASLAWQQAVPLQVLMLCSQVQQLQGALQRCINNLDPSTQQQDEAEGPDEQQQQQPESQQAQEGSGGTMAATASAARKRSLAELVEHTVCSLQSIRRSKDANEAMDSNMAAATVESTPIAGRAAAASSNNSSSGMVQPLSPAAFFSAGGPLAGGLAGLGEPAGPGLWAPPMQPASAHQPQQQQGRQQQPQQQQQAWQVLLGSCAWQAALQQSDQRLAETLAPGSDELLRQIQNVMFRFVRKVGASEKEAAEVYVREFQKLGIDGIDGHAALQACAVPHALEELVATLRKAGLTELGFDTERFERRAAYRERLEAMRRFAAMRMQEAGLCKWLGDNKLHIDDNNIAEGRKRGILSPSESLAKVDTFPDEEDVEDIQRRDLAFTADVERGTDHEQRIAQQQEAAVKQRKDAAYKQLLDKMASLDKELELLAAEALEDEDEQQQHDGQGAGECGRRRRGSEASDKCKNHNGESSDNNASAGSNHVATPPGQASSANGATDAAAATAAAAVPGAQGQRWVLPEEASKAEHALRWALLFVAIGRSCLSPMLRFYSSRHCIHECCGYG